MSNHCLTGHYSRTRKLGDHIPTSFQHSIAHEFLVLFGSADLNSKKRNVILCMGSIINLESTYHQPILELAPFYTILHPQKSFFNPQNPNKKIKNDTCKNPANDPSIVVHLGFIVPRGAKLPCDHHELRVKACFKVAVARPWTGQVDPMPVTCFRVGLSLYNWVDWVV